MAQMFTKQPWEVRNLSIVFPADLDENGAALTAPVLSTVDVFASWKADTLPSTTLAALASAGATSIQLDADPGLGALLILDPTNALAKHDTVKVVAAPTGGPIFVCTIAPPLRFSHSSGNPVNYEPGSTTETLTGIPVISANKVAFTVKGGADQQTYRISALAVDTTGQKREGEIDLYIEES